MPRSHDATAPSRACATYAEVRGEVTVRLDPDSERGMRVTCAIRSNKLTIFKTKDEKALFARMPLGELQVTMWPHRKDLFFLASVCDAGDHIVCCADSEHIRNEWLAVFRRLGIDVATKLGDEDEEYLRARFTGVEIHGDALKARLLRKVRRLEEQQARAWRAEHRAVPAILCDTGWLKRGLSVEASVTDGTHLEIRRGGVLDVSMALAELRISRISRADRVFGFVPHEHAELGKHSQSQCLSTFVLL
jgi:hypothetical protein